MKENQKMTVIRIKQKESPDTAKEGDENVQLKE